MFPYKKERQAAVLLKPRPKERGLQQLPDTTTERTNVPEAFKSDHRGVMNLSSLIHSISFKIQRACCNASTLAEDKPLKACFQTPGHSLCPFCKLALLTVSKFEINWVIWWLDMNRRRYYDQRSLHCDSRWQNFSLEWSEYDNKLQDAICPWYGFLDTKFREKWNGVTMILK